MTTLQSCLDYLDCHGVRYTHTSHTPAYTAKDVAVAEFLPAHSVAKVVVFRGDRGYLLVVVPADLYVDVEQVRAAIGSHDLEKAEESELRILFPQAETGTMPPLGDLAEVPVYLDRALAVQQYVAFAAGTHRDVIHMKTSDFRNLTKPIIGDFSRNGGRGMPIFPIQY